MQSPASNKLRQSFSRGNAGNARTPQRLARTILVIGLILVFGMIPILVLDGCSSIRRQNFEKRAGKINSSLNVVEKRSSGTVDEKHIVLTLTPSQSNAAAFEYLSSVLEPYNSTVPPNQSVAQVLVREFGTDRSDLVAIVKTLNQGLFRELEEQGKDPEHVSVKQPTTILLPNFPLRTTTITLNLFGETNLYGLTARYYPSLPAGVERMILARNRQILDPRELLYGSVTLPDVPVPRLARLRDVQGTSAPNGSDLAAYANVVATVQTQRGAFANPALKTEIETPVSFSLTEENGCDVKGSTTWFLNAIRANDISDSDLQFKRPVRVAVIDSGVDTDHPAFEGILYQPKHEEYVDYDPYSKQILGIDVTDLDSLRPIDRDPKSHGTHVSGLAAGITVLSNSERFMNEKHFLQILVIKITDATSETSNHYIGEALKAARRNDVQILSMSFNAPHDYTIDDEFIKDSTPNLYVIAAGNGKEIKKNLQYNSIDLDPREDFFPAFVGGRQLRGSVLIVAATLPSGKIAPFSNFGPQKVQIAAPGACIFSTIRHDEGKNGYSFLSGTSQATPLVSFAAALLAAKQQYFSAESLKQRLLSSCDWEPSARQFVENGCELNIAKALSTNADIVELKCPPRCPPNPVSVYIGVDPPDKQGIASNQSSNQRVTSVRRGPLLRGKIQNGKFTLRREGKSNLDLPVDDRLRRIWFGDGEPLQMVLLGSKPPFLGTIQEDMLHLATSNPCPYKKSSTGDCLIPLKDVRDIVFSKPGADDNN